VVYQIRVVVLFSSLRLCCYWVPFKLPSWFKFYVLIASIMLKWPAVYTFVVVVVSILLHWSRRYPGLWQPTCVVLQET
jgi:ABC-type uncharacterized transport system permease subunit